MVNHRSKPKPSFGEPKTQCICDVPVMYRLQKQMDAQSLNGVYNNQYIPLPVWVDRLKLKPCPIKTVRR
eukprot:193695-Ditylum_brightwellii.AAC.1